MPRWYCVHNRDMPSARASPEEKVMEFKPKWLHTHRHGICLSDELECPWVCALGIHSFLIQDRIPFRNCGDEDQIPPPASLFSYGNGSFRSMLSSFRSTFWVLLYLYLTNKGKCWKRWIRIFKVLPTGLMYPKAVILVLPRWVWLDVLYEIWIKALYYILYFNLTNQKKHDFLFFWFHGTICSWFSSYFYT